MDIPGLSKVKQCDPEEYSCPTCGILVLCSDRAAGSKCKSSIGLMLTVSERYVFMSWGLISGRLLTTQFGSTMRNISIIQCDEQTESFNTEEQQAFYEQLNATHEKLPKSDGWSECQGGYQSPPYSDIRWGSTVLWIRITIARGLQLSAPSTASSLAAHLRITDDPFFLNRPSTCI